MSHLRSDDPSTQVEEVDEGPDVSGLFGDTGDAIQDAESSEAIASGVGVVHGRLDLLPHGVDDDRDGDAEPTDNNDGPA